MKVEVDWKFEVGDVVELATFPQQAIKENDLKMPWSSRTVWGKVITCEAESCSGGLQKKYCVRFSAPDGNPSRDLVLMHEHELRCPLPIVPKEEEPVESKG